MVRTFAKHALERALVATGLGAVRRRLLRRDTLVLAYHNVLPPGVQARGETSLHLSSRDFERQLAILGKTHQVVPIGEVFATSHSGSRPRAAITFDDAYVGAIEYAIPRLVRLGIPATVFVAPGLLGKHAWWDLLAAPTGSVPTAMRSRALVEHGGKGDAVLAWAGLNSADTDLDGAYRIATSEQITTIATQAGISIGSHSWSHPNLARCDESSLHFELRESMDWLSRRFDSFVPWLAYPYGLHSPEVEAVAASMGYEGALCIDGGWAGSDAIERRYSVSRCDVPAGLSLNGFRLRVDGMWAT